MPNHSYKWNKGRSKHGASSGGYEQQAETPPIPPGGGEDYPNEPPGFTRICESACSVLPLTTLPITASHENQIAGRWWRDNDADTLANLDVFTDATDPQSPTSVYRCKFPSGWADGAAPLFFLGWESPGGGHYQEMYGSVQFKIPSANWENQATGTKVWYVPYANSVRQNHSFLLLDGTGVINAIQSSMALSWYFSQMEADGSDPGFASPLGQNIDSTKYLTCNAWHQIEWYFRLNTKTALTTYDGIFKLWIDEHLVSHYTNMGFCSDANPEGFQQFRGDMVYGGNTPTGVKTRDDFIYLGHIYCSGTGRAT